MLKSVQTSSLFICLLFSHSAETEVHSSGRATVIEVWQKRSKVSVWTRSTVSMVDALLCSRKHVKKRARVPVHVLDRAHDNRIVRDPEVPRLAARSISNDSAKIFWLLSSNVYCSMLSASVSCVNFVGVSSSEVDRVEARLIGLVTMVAPKRKFIQLLVGAEANEKKDTERQVRAKFVLLFNRFNPSSTCLDKVRQPCALFLTLTLRFL